MLVAKQLNSSKCLLLGDDCLNHTQEHGWHFFLKRIYELISIDEINYHFMLVKHQIEVRLKWTHQGGKLSYEKKQCNWGKRKLSEKGSKKERESKDGNEETIRFHIMPVACLPYENRRGK